MRLHPNPTPAIKSEHRRIERLAIDHCIREVMHFELLVHASLRFGMADNQPASGRERFEEAFDYLPCGCLIEIDRHIATDQQIDCAGAIDYRWIAWLGQ